VRIRVAGLGQEGIQGKPGSVDVTCKPKGNASHGAVGESLDRRLSGRAVAFGPSVAQMEPRRFQNGQPERVDQPPVAALLDRFQ
jgi:hypothetical protein